MADEQALTEQPVTEETQDQSTEVESSGSEAAQTQETASDNGRGDLNEALRQAREEKRALEARLSDPNFIYQQARSLGLTEEEAEQAAQVQPTAQFVPSDPYGQYKYFQELDKSREKYPELAEDEDAQLAVTALMTAKRLSPLAAADRYFGKFQKIQEKAKEEGMKEKETVISDKEKAQTVTSTSSTDSDAAEYENLLARSRDFRDPKAADKAQLELIKWREKHK